MSLFLPNPVISWSNTTNPQHLSNSKNFGISSCAPTLQFNSLGSYVTPSLTVNYLSLVFFFCIVHSSGEFNWFFFSGLSSDSDYMYTLQERGNLLYSHVKDNFKKIIKKKIKIHSQLFYTSIFSVWTHLHWHMLWCFVTFKPVIKL